jgi:hypothetical protein
MGEKKEQKAAEPKKDLNKQVPNNVVAMGPAKCMGEDCKSKPARAGFCELHFEWFKLGLITKMGAKVPDFDKKFHHYEATRNNRKTA